MRAAAIAGAIVAAFIGVMYVRFSGDAVPSPEPMQSPIVGADGSVCIVSRADPSPDPTPTPVAGEPTRIPCTLSTPRPPSDPLAGLQPLPATPQPAIPGIVKGMKIIPLELGPPLDLPRDVSLILETGCWGCEGGPRGLVRVYLRPDGSVAYDSLLDPAALGLPVLQYTAPNGTVNEYPPFITGYATTPDASDIVAGICVSGTCAPDGLSSWSPDSRTVLFRSTNGGVTWEEIGRLEVGATVFGLLGDGEILLATYDGGVSTVFRTYPALTESNISPGIGYWNVEVLPSGDLVWQNEDGVLVRSDGTPLISPSSGATWINDVLVQPGSMDGLAHVSGPAADGSHTYYLVPFDSDGTVASGSFANPGEAVAWSKGPDVLGMQLPNGGLILGNASVPTSEVAQNGNPYVTHFVPVVVDLEAGTMHAIEQFWNGVVPRSRNLVAAIQQGPFARVVNTDNTCLYIREAPDPTSPALDCAAEGVLLRDLAAVGVSDGTWHFVATPAGVEGWASTQYLER